MMCKRSSLKVNLGKRICVCLSKNKTRLLSSLSLRANCPNFVVVFIKIKLVHFNVSPTFFQLLEYCLLSQDVRTLCIF